MKSAVAVIGAGYGDEGKGLMTDYFCHAQKSPERTLVVRYNGGAQAGHTVVTPDGRRHVFSHFGAGSFVGASTFLSDDFIVNPMLFFKELQQLSKTIDGVPKVLISANCRVTTPYDMLLNQCVEANRTNRHGSCGVGIFDTISRHKQIPFSISSILNSSDAELRETLDEIKQRAIALVSDTSVYRISYEQLFDLDYFPRFYSDLLNIISLSEKICDESDAFNGFDSIVFESAQGLLLSEAHGVAPHLTPSDPGISTPLALCHANKIEHLDVYYVSRAYTTRHGNGPLVNETLVSDMGLYIKNETNVTNDFQGSFRYSPLDVSGVSSAINSDFKNAQKYALKSIPVTASKNLALTCVDQVNVSSWNVYAEKMDELIDIVKPDNLLVSHGPDRSAVLVGAL
jgi:adenylosuccinate synthase